MLEENNKALAQLRLPKLTRRTYKSLYNNETTSYDDGALYAWRLGDYYNFYLLETDIKRLVHSGKLEVIASTFDDEDMTDIYKLLVCTK